LGRARFAGVAIYVGKSAADNDVLSIDPERTIRDQNDWWMHVAGSPGSHVVIRCSDAFAALPRETLVDAAALAAKYSKVRPFGCTGGARLGVCNFVKSK
jgi:predicted ribosome quality control (RQC) complex YloA/Tae2 family protein